MTPCFTGHTGNSLSRFLVALICAAGCLLQPAWSQSSVEYQISDISHLLAPAFLHDAELIESNGQAVELQQLLASADSQPVIFQFIFTSCANVCPVMSTILQAIQKEMADQAQLVSISIDPGYDTSERLQSYAERFGAMKHWRFFTGDTTTIVQLQKRLNIYQQNKMRHQPVTFIAVNQRLLRIDGLLSRQQMLSELGRLLEGPVY